MTALAFTGAFTIGSNLVVVNSLEYRIPLPPPHIHDSLVSHDRGRQEQVSESWPHPDAKCRVRDRNKKGTCSSDHENADPLELWLIDPIILRGGASSHDERLVQIRIKRNKALIREVPDEILAQDVIAPDIQDVQDKHYQAIYFYVVDEPGECEKCDRNPYGKKRDYILSDDIFPIVRRIESGERIDDDVHFISHCPRVEEVPYRGKQCQQCDKAFFRDEQLQTAHYRCVYQSGDRRQLYTAKILLEFQLLPCQDREEPERDDLFADIDVELKSLPDILGSPPRKQVLESVNELHGNWRNWPTMMNEWPEIFLRNDTRAKGAVHNLPSRPLPRVSSKSLGTVAD